MFLGINWCGISDFLLCLFQKFLEKVSSLVCNFSIIEVTLEVSNWLLSEGLLTVSHDMRFVSSLKNLLELSLE